MKEKETALNRALRFYQIQKPKQDFFTYCVVSGFYSTFSKEEIKEAKEISKTLRV